MKTYSNITLKRPCKLPTSLQVRLRFPRVLTSVEILDCRNPWTKLWKMPWDCFQTFKIARLRVRSMPACLLRENHPKIRGFTTSSKTERIRCHRKYTGPRIARKLGLLVAENYSEGEVFLGRSRLNQFTPSSHGWSVYQFIRLLVVEPYLPTYPLKNWCLCPWLTMIN